MNTELGNLFSAQNPDVMYPVSYSQHCIALNNFNKTGYVSRELQSMTDGTILARIFYSRHVGYDSKRQNSKGIYRQNKQKEEICSDGTSSSRREQYDTCILSLKPTCPPLHPISNRWHWLRFFLLPWMRFFCALSSVVRQMPGYN